MTVQTLHWTYRWETVRPKEDSQTQAGRDNDAGSIPDRLAPLLGRSARSLQRDIKSAGHSISSLVRGARSTEACHLLRGTEMSLSDIGYWCGYAEQAHLQRDFRRAVNMTPARYRETSLDR